MLTSRRHHAPTSRLSHIVRYFGSILAGLSLSMLFIAGCGIGSPSVNKVTPAPTLSPTWTADPQQHMNMEATVKAWLSKDTYDLVVQEVEGQPFHEELGKVQILKGIPGGVVVSPIYQEQSPVGDLRMVCLILDPNGKHAVVVYSGGDDKILSLNGTYSKYGFVINTTEWVTDPLNGGTLGNVGEPVIMAKSVAAAIAAFLDKENFNRRIAVFNTDYRYIDPASSIGQVDPPITDEFDKYYKPGAAFMAWELGRTKKQPTCVATTLAQVLSLLSTSDRTVLPLTREVTYG